MRFVTLNIWSGFNYRGKVKFDYFETKEARAKREEILIEGLKELNADVIFLNEVNPVPAQSDRLRRALKMDAVSHIGVSGLKIGAFGIPTNLREADLILTRPELEAEPVGRVHLAGKGFVSNWASFHTGNLTQAVAVKLKNSDGRFFCAAVTHWLACPEWKGNSIDKKALATVASMRGFKTADLLEAEKRLNEDCRLKRQEASRLLDFFERKLPNKMPIVVGGDFNAGPDWESIQMMKNGGFVDLFAEVGEGDGFTWDPLHNANISRYYTEESERKKAHLYDTYHDIDELIPRRIDYLWARRCGKAESCRLCFHETEEGEFPASDHFGLVADLEVGGTELE